MREIADIKSQISGIREQIQNGADPQVMASSLSRVENQLSDMLGEHEEERKARVKARNERFFGKKKKREGNWENPLKF